MKTFSQTRLEQAINLIVDEGKPIKEISIRCPFCGDSRKNPRETHLGVKLDHPTMFHCFRCDESGSVNAKFLKAVGIDKDIIKKWVKFKKSDIYRSMPTVKEVSFKKNNIEYNFNLYKDSPQYKYLCDRFKIEFTEEDIKRYRVILNPIIFLKDLSRAKNKEIKAKIDLSRYIGFATQNGDQLVFRAIDKNREPRFYNLTIEETEYRKLYVLDNYLNVKADSFNFVLTEGIFDMIGVYEHFFKDSKSLDNTIFLAALGKSFQEPINRLIQSGFLDFNIYLFADSSEDIDLDFYEDLFKNKYINEIYIARNKKEGEKDFGVSLDRVEFDDYELLNRRKIKSLRQKEKSQYFKGNRK